MSSPATTPLTYNGYVSQIATLAVEQTATINGVVTPQTPYLQTVLPQALNYAELRIQRDLDIENLKVANTNYSLTAGVNTLTISANDFVTIETFSVASGTATVPLLPVAREFLQNVYNDTAYVAPPMYFAPIGGDASSAGVTSSLYQVGPCPDQNYPVTLTGAIRMPTLAQNASSGSLASTATTFISTYHPDLLIMASMVYITAYQRNFGAASDDPQMGATYETQYQTLLRGALGEEGRKRFAASGWSSSSQPVAATPGR